MGTYPYLSLDQVPIDAELVRRLPRKLAYYHLALPLAIEGDEVSVALAYPDNALVLDVLEGILGAPIVPVQAEATHIRAVLDRVWQHIERPAPHILSWGSDTSAAEWARVVADGLAPIFGARVTDLRENEAETVIALSQHDQFTFTVISSVADVPPIDLVRHAATPILLLQGGQAHKAARLSGRILAFAPWSFARPKRARLGNPDGERVSGGRDYPGRGRQANLKSAPRIPFATKPCRPARSGCRASPTSR